MLTKDALKAIKGDFLRGSNLLRKLFRTQGNASGVREQGHSLNGKALVRSFISARSCRENSDRFVVNVKKPQAKAVFSFAIDFSGSMSRNGSRNESYFPHASTWEQVLGCLYGVTHVAESVGIKSKVAFIEFENGYTDKGYGMGESTRNVIKDFEEKAWSEDYTQKLARLNPHDGDDLAEYARHAIAMVEHENAQHKVAFFMTDGVNNYSHLYYQSLAEQAKAKGVKLIGISYCTPLNKAMPNGIYVEDSKQLASAILKELEKLF